MLSLKLPATLYKNRISVVPYFDKLHLLVFPVQNAHTEVLKGISAKQLSCCFYKFAPKDIAVIRGIKHTLHGVMEIIPYFPTVLFAFYLMW